MVVGNWRKNFRDENFLIYGIYVGCLAIYHIVGDKTLANTGFISRGGFSHSHGIGLTFYYIEGPPPPPLPILAMENCPLPRPNPEINAVSRVSLLSSSYEYMCISMYMVAIE